MLVMAMVLAACSKPASIKIATDATFAPFEYTNDAGDLVGFDIDLMNAIAEKAGFELSREIETESKDRYIAKKLTRHCTECYESKGEVLTTLYQL
ncbi:MAG: transporter substrate-binding domain-containing protein [Anaerolineae bacterium]|nr:transporter substrate-binding domain-containing protein [Anaerolineae bacterium]